MAREFHIDLDLNAHKVTDLAPGTAGTDAVNKNQLDSVAAGSGATTLDGLSDVDVTTAIDGDLLSFTTNEVWLGVPYNVTGGGQNSPAFAWDGNAGTTWNNSGAPNNPVAEYPTPVTANRIKINGTNAGYGTPNKPLMGSNNGTDWTTVNTATPWSGGEQTTDFPAATYKYWYILFNPYDTVTDIRLFNVTDQWVPVDGGMPEVYSTTTAPASTGAAIIWVDSDDTSIVGSIPAVCWVRWTGTQAEYTALGTYDPNVLYVII